MTSHTSGSYLAFDLGASSGRVFLGTLKQNALEYKEIHRYITPILEIDGHLFWDIDVMWAEMRRGLELALRIAPDLRSVSVDSWAVDYVSLDASGALIRNPYCYRDTRTNGLMEEAFRRISPKEIYDITGIQFLPFNTLYQLLAEAKEATSREESERAREVVCYMPVADYFNYRFSGQKAVELSMASTTQMMDVHQREWSSPLMERLGLNPALWPRIVSPGTILGPVQSAPNVSVVATCSHDTGSAVAAAPAPAPAPAPASAQADSPWAFISCGTWSLLGTERAQPLLTDTAREAGFTNEAGLDGTIRLLKNLTGLWVLQECAREWGISGEVDWSQLEEEARRARLKNREDIATKTNVASAVIDLEDARFMARGNMEVRIHSYCEDSGITRPASRGEIVLLIIQSIADSYRRALIELQRVTDTRYNRIHLFGGGSRNRLLCELTASACNVEVVAGPVEAAVMGNLLIQARAMGDIPDETSIRDIVSNSTELTVYSPVTD